MTMAITLEVTNTPPLPPSPRFRHLHLVKIDNTGLMQNLNSDMKA